MVTQTFVLDQPEKTNHCWFVVANTTQQELIVKNVTLFIRIVHGEQLHKRRQMNVYVSLLDPNPFTSVMFSLQL